MVHDTHRTDEAATDGHGVSLNRRFDAITLRTHSNSIGWVLLVVGSVFLVAIVRGMEADWLLPARTINLGEFGDRVGRSGQTGIALFAAASVALLGLMALSVVRCTIDPTTGEIRRTATLPWPRHHRWSADQIASLELTRQEPLGEDRSSPPRPATWLLQITAHDGRTRSLLGWPDEQPNDAITAAVEKTLAKWPERQLDRAADRVLIRASPWGQWLVAGLLLFTCWMFSGVVTDAASNLWNGVGEITVYHVFTSVVGVLVGIALVPIALLAVLLFLSAEWALLAIDGPRRELVSRRISLIGWRWRRIPFGEIESVEARTRDGRTPPHLRIERRLGNGCSMPVILTNVFGRMPKESEIQASAEALRHALAHRPRRSEDAA